jgi:hypothetical protein
MHDPLWLLGALVIGALAALWSQIKRPPRF